MPRLTKKDKLIKEIVSNSEVAFFASDEEILIYEHFVLLGMEAVKPTKKKESYPEYEEFCRIWDEKYHEIGFQMPKDGTKIKSLIRQTRDYINKAGGLVSTENVVNFWCVFVGNLQNTWGHGKDLSTIDSKYMSLIFEMKHGKKQGFNQRTSTQRIIDSL